MPVTLDQILNFVDRDEPNYVQAAVYGDEALPILQQLMAGGDEARAVKAASLASVIATPAAASLLSSVVATAVPTVKVAIAVGIRNFTPGAAGPILDQLANDSDLGVRRIARTAIRDGDLASTLEFVDWTSADSEGASGTLHGHDVRLVGTMGTAFALHGEFTAFDTDAFTPRMAATDSVEISAGPGAGLRYTITFAAPVLEPVIHLASFGSILQFDAGVVATRLSGTRGFEADGSTVTGEPANAAVPGGPTDSWGSIRLRGAFTVINFTVTPNWPDASVPNGIYLHCGASVDV